MRFSPNAVVVFLLLLLTASLSVAAEDWQLASYDKAEALFLAFDQKEAELLKQYEPRVAEFYEVFGPFQDADRKMRRYAFLKQLRKKSEMHQLDQYLGLGQRLGHWNEGTRKISGRRSSLPGFA